MQQCETLKANKLKQRFFLFAKQRLDTFFAQTFKLLILKEVLYWKSIAVLDYFLLVV